MQQSGRLHMQIRFLTDLTEKAYVETRAWRLATLEACPRHGEGRCSFARHGTYVRMTP